MADRPQQGRREIVEKRVDKATGIVTYYQEGSTYNPDASTCERMVAYPATSDPAELVGELVEALEPAAPWLGSHGEGTTHLYECECCHRRNEDYTQIEHTEKCYVPKIRAALARAREWQKGGEGNG